MTYEISLYQHEEEELKKKKEKGVAFKADIEGESDKNSEDVESELSDHEMAFLARKFKKFMRSKNYFPRRKKIDRNESNKELGKEEEKKVPMCFECNKSGHYKSECPHLYKEHKKKKKAFMTAWGDSESSSSEDELKETANICFMARGDEVSVGLWKVHIKLK